VITWPPDYLSMPNNALWLGCVRHYSDCADADGVTIKQLRRGHHPYRIRFTRAEALQLLERGDLREYAP
jgi:hypothetical protein